MSTTTSTAPQKSNIRKLAEYIYSTGHAWEILTMMEALAEAGAFNHLRKTGAQQEGGEAV